MPREFESELGFWDLLECLFRIASPWLAAAEMEVQLGESSN